MAFRDVIKSKNKASEEDLTPIKPRIGLVISGCAILLVLALIKVTFSAQPTDTFSVLAKDVLSLFSAEFGVALLVAFFVSWTIDARVRQQELMMKRREDEQREERRASDAAELKERQKIEAAENERRQSLIAQNVVQGVYGLQHNPSYVKAVIETNLKPDVVRKSADLEYSLRELTAEEIALTGVDPDRFVVLEMLSSYTFLNVSSSEKPVDVRYAVAVRHGEGAKSFTGVKTATIGDQDLSPEDIASAIEANGHDSEKSYIWPRRVAGNGTLFVTIKVLALKERSDNEVWGSFFPTVSGATLRFTVLPGMRFGIRPLTASPTVCNRREKVLGVWKCTGSILPNDSVVFWWRTPEDDAEVVLPALDPHVECGTGAEDIRSLDINL